MPSEPHSHAVAPALINHLRELQAQRSATIRMQLRIDNSCRALVRRFLGYDPTLDEEVRAKLNKQAERMVAAIQKGQAQRDTHETAALGQPARDTQLSSAAVAPFVLASLESRCGFDAHRKNTEKAMEKAVAQLPVWPWWSAIRGVGAVGLASIIGEANDLSNYDNPAKLWKRMGLAVIGGGAQRKSKTDAELHGYNPRRRSVMWVIGDSLIKGNRDGHYKTMYDERKITEAANPEVKTKMHAHRRAQRYMEKRLLRDLWSEWNRDHHPH